jgi:hypothetical protein
MRKLLTLSLGLALLFSCTEQELPMHFMQLLIRSKMIFIEPDQYSRIDSVKNEKMTWDLAYLNPIEKLEIRYAIRPMDIKLKEYQEQASKSDSSEIIHPNKFYQRAFKDVLHNISDGQSSEYSVFSPIAIKNEFNADWGATALVNVGKEFETDYKFCYIIFIHKDNIGDAYIYCLANDVKLIDREMMKYIHNLRFIQSI